ncbi:MAG: hypothetical protein AAFP90_11895 [Planctomycetota bacterium]
MSIVLVSGALQGADVTSTVIQSVFALLGFAVIGAMAGWTIRLEVERSTEASFRRELERYRQEVDRNDSHREMTS